MTAVADILRVAASQNGYVESGNNQTKYWAELDPSLQGNPWCAVFASWVFKTAGMPLPNMGKPYGYVYVPAAMNYANARGLWDASGHYSPGDIVCYGGGTHTGIIATDDRVTMTVWEGNTSPDSNADGSQTNGGQVALRHRLHSPWVNGVIKTSRWLSIATSLPTSHPASHPASYPVPQGGLHVNTIDLSHADNAHIVRGKGVAPLQRLLQIKADGLGGAGTRAALYAYQSAHGLKPDAVFGLITATSLLAG